MAQALRTASPPNRAHRCKCLRTARELSWYRGLIQHGDPDVLLRSCYLVRASVAALQPALWRHSSVVWRTLSRPARLDISVSLIMAVPAWSTAPCSLRVFLERRCEHLPQALFWSWFTIDETYAAYWYPVAPVALLFPLRKRGRPRLCTSRAGLCGCIAEARGRCSKTLYCCHETFGSTGRAILVRHPGIVRRRQRFILLPACGMR